MKPHYASRSSLRAATVIASILAVAGVIMLVVAIRAQRSAPQPSPAAAGQIIEPTTRHSTSTSAKAPRIPASTITKPNAGMPASKPVAVTVSSIGVSSLLTTLDRNADGTLQVPDSFGVAGWYDRSVTPGQVGPTIIVGHVDSTSGPGIFYRLGSVRPGDLVSVQRQDGKAVTYRITGVREYAKDEFPTIDVYGDTPIPTLRLITCGGTFDNATHHYLSNIVAYGQLA